MCNSRFHPPESFPKRQVANDVESQYIKPLRDIKVFVFANVLLNTLHKFVYNGLDQALLLQDSIAD